jgi:hypothetical protein
VIRAQLHVGQPRARRLQEYLFAKVSGHGEDLAA